VKFFQDIELYDLDHQ